MTRKDDETYVFSTGREFTANHGLIGLSKRTSPFSRGMWEVSEGYDGMLLESTGRAYDYLHERGEAPDPNWTQAERVELAKFMIEQWALFALEMGYADPPPQ